MDSKLLFQNPVFNEGLNLTCRKGTKWADAKGIIPIYQTNTDNHVGNAEILDAQVVPFNMLDNEDLSYEHDPSCRTVEGLHKAMTDVYPDFTSNDTVTLVYFDFKSL